MRIPIFIAVFLLANVYSSFAAESFFNFTGFSFNKLVDELYEDGKILQPDSYSALRHIVAKQIAFDYRPIIEKEWGEPTGTFLKWLEAHPDLLENFLTALDLQYDDLPQALRLMKQLCTDYPGIVEQYPELTIAASVIWDQPDCQGFARNSWEQYKAILPEYCDVKDNFLYYTQKDYPAADRMKTLPWEFLSYIISNKRSLEERKWVFDNYCETDKTEIPAKAYNDIQWINQDPPPLAGFAYTLQNMRKYGGVCTCQADFAIPVARTLGIPAFYGGAGFPGYYGGHSWVMWLDIKEIASNEITFDFKEEWRTNPRFYIGGYYCPQTEVFETDEMIKLRFHRAGKNLKAFRQAELLRRSYQTIIETTKVPLAGQVELLEKINALSPGNVSIWKEIAALGKEKKFSLKNREMVKLLCQRMREDLLAYPNELPRLTFELTDFPEMQNQREKIFDDLCASLHAKGRPDLVIETTINTANVLLEPLRNRLDHHYPSDISRRHQTVRKNAEAVQKAIDKLGILAFYYPDEISLMYAVFDQLEMIADLNEFGSKAIVGNFYRIYVQKLTTDWKKLNKDFRKDTFNRALAFYERNHITEDIEKMKTVIKALETE